MQLRSLLSGAVAALLFCGAAHAAGLGGTLSVPQRGLPGVCPAQGQDRTMKALSSDKARDGTLRQVHARIEELNFQIMQLQEQIRKMQEDNEFRFQELEDKKTDAGGAKAPRKHTMADPALQPGAPSEMPAAN